MSTTAPQFSFDSLKQELARLHSYTSEIGKAQEITTQVQEAAIAVIEAAEAVDLRQRQFLDKLQSDHLNAINMQSGVLRKAAKQQVDDAQQILQKEIGSLRESAKNTILALQQVVTEQPRILAAISSKHEQGIDAQSTLIRQSLANSADNLNKQFTGQIIELQQARQAFDTAVGKQLDSLTTITDRLQVISGSLTAFRDAMNAAKFSDRLEALDAQQAATISHLGVLKEQLGALKEQQTTVLSRFSRFDELQVQNEQITAKLMGLKSQNTLLLVAVAVGVVVSIALRFI